MTYPETPTVDQTDTYHGTVVRDPYRWLEQDVREAPEVARWVEAQNALTSAYLEEIPERAAIEARLRELWNYERYSVPVRKGGRYFYRRNDGLQNQAVLYVQPALEAEPEVLLDPNAWSADGSVALADAFPSPDGRYLAYTVQDGGSDWRSARVLDLATREHLPETLEWLKFSGIAWAPDGSGFYYSRYPAPEEDEKFTSLNRNQSLWWHALGTPHAEDVLVYARPDHPEWGFHAEVSHDGRHLVVAVWIGTDDRNQVVYLDRQAEVAQPRMLVEGFEAGYSFLGSVGNELYFRTNAQAPKGRIVRLSAAGRAEAVEVVPEGEHVLTGAELVGGRLVGHYLEDARSAVRVFGLDGAEVRRVDLPGAWYPGRVSG